MGFFDAIFGRTKPKQANLDDLFALPPAALTLQAATDYVPTGVGAVAFRQVEGGAFAQVEAESKALITSDPDCSVEQVNDGFGYTWQIVTDAEANIPNLVTNLHAINSSLENQGFGPMLLCSTVFFKNSRGGRAALVYLYKRGTFYPFVQVGHQQRDNAQEIQLRGVLDTDLPMEDDLSKWSPLWDAPGLTMDPPRGELT